MRILFVSNFFPPHHLGGYELGCRDVVGALTERGHECAVLTSFWGLDAPAEEGDIFRTLVNDAHLANRHPFVQAYEDGALFKERWNHQAFADRLAAFRPDVVYFWNMTALSMGLVAEARRRGLPTAFYISDGWMGRWTETDQWYRRLQDLSSNPLQRSITRIRRSLTWGKTLQYSAEDIPYANIQCCSRFLIDDAVAKGKPLSGAQVIHWGVRISDYPYRTEKHATPSLLYAGTVVPHKGLATVIRALSQIVAEPGLEQTRLVVAGGDPTAPDRTEKLGGYVGEMARLAQSLGIESNVEFLGMLPRTQLPEVFRAHDIMIFPSEWDEPFAITPLEAMASGLAIVGTTTGGSREIFQDGVNSLTFTAGDDKECAAKTKLLLKDSALLERLRAAGRQDIETRFTLENMVTQIETNLKQAIAGKPRP